MSPAAPSTAAGSSPPPVSSTTALAAPSSTVLSPAPMIPSTGGHPAAFSAVLTDALVHSTMGAAMTSTLGPAFSFPMQPYMGSLGPSAAYGTYDASPYLQQSATPPQFGGSAAPSPLLFGGSYGGTLPSAFPPASSFDAAYPGGASTSTLAPPAPAPTSIVQ
jgi:hypothetical protein